MNRHTFLGAGVVLVMLGGAAAYWWPSSPARETRPDVATSPSPTRPASAPAEAGPHTSELTTTTAASSFEEAAAGDRPVDDSGRRFKQAVAAGGVEINDAIENLLPAWAARAPREALDYADSLADGPLRESILHRIIQAWGEKAPAAALDWIATRVNAAERHSFAIAVCQQIAKTDPLSAIAVAERAGVARDNSDFVPYLVETWAEKDASTALAWVRSQPEGENRDEYMAKVVLTLAQGADYDRAVKLALNEIPAGVRQDDALLVIVNQWAQRDLESATVWVETFSIANPLRGRAFAEIEGARRVRRTTNAAGL